MEKGKHREHVSRAKRDGLKEGRRKRHDPERLTTCLLDGVQAFRGGTPRYANPYKNERARAWTIGWNTAHGRLSVCRGCELCLSGTRQASLSDIGTMARITKGHVEWDS